MVHGWVDHNLHKLVENGIPFDYFKTISVVVDHFLSVVASEVVGGPIVNLHYKF